MPEIATALVTADQASPELAAQAVRRSLERTRSPIAHSVLLFLSSDFAHQAHPALLAASRAAQCLSITGCTAPGLFTDEDWVLDRPAAAAMVFCGNCGPAAHPQDCAPRLTLATPASALAGWPADGQTRFGLLATDDSAQNAGRIWCHGKLVDGGWCETAWTGVRSAVGLSRGLRILGPAQAALSEDLELLQLGGQPALKVLQRELPIDLRTLDKLPLHQLAAAVTVDAPDDTSGLLIPVLSVNPDRGSVTLSQALPPGSRVCWTLRQALAAEQDVHRLCDRLRGRLDAEPEFALLFSCLGRGPWFFGGEDRDLAVVRERFPGLPLIGAYGGGQIAPTVHDEIRNGHHEAIHGGAHEVHNSVVLALFRSEPGDAHDERDDSDV